MRFVVIILLLVISFSVNANPVVRIAAAADLQLALPDVIEEFQKHNPKSNLSVTYGSSGVFTSQLRNGAPFELFFSANTDFVNILYKDGLTLSEGTQYAFGRLAFISSEQLTSESASEAILEWHHMMQSNQKLSIANPLHAPYGMAAVDWLKNISIESLVQSRLVMGENAAQSVQFVLAGAARGGIVAWPLVANRESFQGQAWLIPQDEHIPLEQKMVLMNRASQTAKDFYQFMQTEKAQKVLSSHGFGVP